jgi:hypothetical protein
MLRVGERGVKESAVSRGLGVAMLVGRECQR